MSSDEDLIQLYSRRILALAADIPHAERLTAPDLTAKRRSPLCGSTVTVDLVVTDGVITDFGQDVKACALGQASASIFGQKVIGMNRSGVEAVRGQLLAMMKENGPVPAAPFDDFEVLLPAREYKNRHASIMLVFDATLAAFDSATPPA
jgi:NifU-like protein involved in Fe-S cluster formation